MKTTLGRLSIESKSAARSLAIGLDELGSSTPLDVKALAMADLQLTEGFETRSTDLNVRLTPSDGKRAALLVQVNGALEWVLPQVVEATQDSLGGVTYEFSYEVPAELKAMDDSLGFLKKLKVFVFEYLIPVATGEKTLLEAIEEGLGHENEVLRITSADPSHWRPLKTGVVQRGDRVLVLIHGTFTQLTGSFGHLIEHSGQALEEWIGAYDHVLGLNHFTLAHTPTQNAQVLLDALAGVQELELDMVGTSRGALVIRALLEDLSPSFTVREVIGVCPAFGGTELGRPENWKRLLNTVTNLAKTVAVALPATAAAAAWVVGIAGFLKVLSAFVFGDLQAIPGLAAMNPGGAYLTQLNAGSSTGLPVYNAMTSDYEGQAEQLGDMFGPPTGSAGRAALFAADRAVDALFKQESNDLVIDNESGERVRPGTEVRFHGLPANSSVHHLNHLACKRVVRFLELRLEGQALRASVDWERGGSASALAEEEYASAEAGPEEDEGDYPAAEAGPDEESDGWENGHSEPRFFQLQARAQGESTQRTRALKWNVAHTLRVSIGPRQSSTASAIGAVTVTAPQTLSLLTQSLVPDGIAPRLDTLTLPEHGASTVLSIDLPAAQSVALGFTLFNQDGRLVHQYQWFPPSLPGDENVTIASFRPLAVAFQPESGGARSVSLISGPQATTVAQGERLVAANLSQVDHLTDRLAGLIEAAPVGNEAQGWKVLPSQAAETWRGLARVGAELLGRLFEGVPEMRAAFIAAPAIQVLTLDASRVLPVELIYMLPPPHHDDDVEILGPEVPVPTPAPSDRSKVYLSAFVGLSKRIERLNLPADPELQRDFTLRLAPRDAPRTVPLDHVLFAGSSRVDSVADGSLEDLGLALATTLRGHARVMEATDWPDWKGLVDLRKPKLLILLPHTEPGGTGELNLELGERSFLPVLDLDEESLGQEPLLALLLGCNTGNAHGFEHVVGRLSRKGVVACVATLSTIRGRHAAPIAAGLVQALLDQPDFGHAVLEARRALVSAGYPVAMTLAGFGDIDIRV